ncbi:MAG TPA: hypothetical protein ENJ09_01615 [Planctomycetes bacterium]|nr:hypothetical protein [Planctomycetota bacterium]
MAARIGVGFLLILGAANATAQEPLGSRWAAVEALPPESQDRLPRAAALLMEAGDFGGALLLAERALERDPENLELLWRAASISVSLRDAGRARRHADALWAAVQDRASGDREWQSAALELERSADQLEEHAAERVRLLRRARLLSGGIFAVLLAALAWLLRADAAGRPGSGKVQEPVL